jgi:hypothetical protein
VIDSRRCCHPGPTELRARRGAMISLLDTGATGSPLVDAIVLRARAPNLGAAYRLSYRTQCRAEAARG